MDILAAMGISGFGKAVQKRQLDPSRFDKNKRQEVSVSCCCEKSWIHQPPSAQISKSPTPTAGPSLAKKPSSIVDSTTDLEDEQGPKPTEETIQKDGLEDELEYDPEEAQEDDDLPIFPITHEVILKDHTKVISALGLDPSGARLVSGSYDYDCKLWDFGGMDLRCKPFKSWEPAGTYYVRWFRLRSAIEPFYMNLPRFMTSNSRMMGASFCAFRGRHKLSFSIGMGKSCAYPNVLDEKQSVNS